MTNCSGSLILQRCPRKAITLSVRSYIKRKYPAYPSDQQEEEIKEIKYSAGKDSKQVYVWGLTEHGGLGIQRQLKDKAVSRIPKFLHRPNRLSFAEHHNITDVACGYGFTAFAVNSNNTLKVFGSGINTDSQIGYQSQRKDAPMNVLLAPVPITLPISTSCRVTSLAAGRSHLLVLVEEKVKGTKVFTLGNNSYGQCGREIKLDEDYSGSKTVHCIENLDGDHIRSVSCGQDHSLFVTNKGKVYSCGWGADGQTGHGHYCCEWLPNELTGDLQGENIVKVACTADCNLAINDKGDLFGWGNSEYKQLLREESSETQLHTPRLIRMPEVGPVVDAVAGGSFCAVLNARGEVWVWGFGLLGLGPEVTQASRPLQIPATLLGHTPLAPPSHRITSLSAGLFHLAALSSHGDLFTWGRNKSGCLGLGHSKDQPFPLRVSIGVNVLKAACGVDHMVALCRPFA